MYIYCVNALKGATSISTKVTEKALNQAIEVCQCPERGDLHFYLCMRQRIRIMNTCLCQCPERGDLHFYTCLWEPA